MSKFKHLSLLLFLISTLCLSQTAVAQQPPPPIIQNEATINFPESVDFVLEWPADANITSAVLHYDVDRMSCLEADTQVPVDLVTNTDSILAQWTWVMGRSGNPPPGTELSWYWVLTDMDGHVTQTPQQTKTFTDDRFPWQTVSAEGIDLHWYRGEEVGPLLLDAAVTGLDTLERDMGIQLQDDVDIYIYGSAADMRDALLFVQDWAGGIAFDEYNTILMGVQPSSAESWGRSTMRHELAHLVIGQYGWSCVGGSRPTWLNEGLAVYAEGEPAPDIIASIQAATQTNSFEPLRTLNGAFSAHGPAAGIAYAQSYSVVDFLLREYGQEAMQRLLLTLAEGTSYDEALMEVYGMDVDGVEAAWRAALSLPPRTFPPTPTPVLAANVPTAVPMGKPENVPTPPAAAEPPPVVTERPFPPPQSGICGVGMIPFVGLGFVFVWSRGLGKRVSTKNKPLLVKLLTSKKFFIVISASLLFGCQLVNVPLEGSGFARQAPHVAQDDAVVLKSGQPLTMDPALTHGGPDSPLGHIFSGLVSLDTDLQVQPELAAGWEVSEDGLTYTFYLRKDALFHNGRSLTSADVIYSWERAADPATGSDTAQTYLGDIDGVSEKLTGAAESISGLRAIDDHTLEVRLNAPVVYFLAKLAYPVAYVVDHENVTQPDWEHHANGSGPFKLERWQDDVIILLARFDEYYLEPAKVSRVVYDLGEGLALSMYEQGEIDLIGAGGGILEKARDPNNPFNQELRTTAAMCTSTIGLNNKRAPFDDVRVRQAFNYALDKELLIETFAGGNALVARGSLPPGMPGYGLSGVTGYPYNPELARQLLAEAGYAEMSTFPTLSYSISGYGDVNAYVTAVITMWQENLGVTIEPVIIDPYTYYDEIYAGNIGHFYASGWCADYPDPQNFLDILYHSQSRQNIGGFSDADIDALLEAARIEPDPTTRLRMYADAERAIVDAAPVVFTRHGLTAVLVKPRLENYVLTPMGVRQWQNVSIKPAE